MLQWLHIVCLESSLICSPAPINQTKNGDFNQILWLFWFILWLWVVWRLVWSQYWIENIPQSPVSLWASDHSYSTPPCVPSLHFPRQLPVAFSKIFQALAENCAIHAVRRHSDQSCPVTMSKTATTINYFVLENTHVACLCYLFDMSMFWLLQSKKYF